MKTILGIEIPENLSQLNESALQEIKTGLKAAITTSMADESSRNLETTRQIRDAAKIVKDITAIVVEQNEIIKSLDEVEEDETSKPKTENKDDEDEGTDPKIINEKGIDLSQDLIDTIQDTNLNDSQLVSAALAPSKNKGIIVTASTYDERVVLSDEALSDKVQTFVKANRGKSGGREILASLPRYGKGTEIVENLNSPESVTAGIFRGIEAKQNYGAPQGKAVTAALTDINCGPGQLVPNANACEGATTPFLDSFVQVPANANGIGKALYYAPLTIQGLMGDAGNGVNLAEAASRIWTETKDNAVDFTDPATLKECDEYDRCDPSSQGIYGIPSCILAKNSALTQIPNAEASIREASAAKSALIAELLALYKFHEYARYVSYGGATTGGAIPTFTRVVAAEIASIRVSRRARGLVDSDIVVAVTPGVREVMIADASAQAFYHDFDLDAHVRRLGARVVDLVDDFGSVWTPTVQQFPTWVASLGALDAGVATAAPASPSALNVMVYDANSMAAIRPASIDFRIYDDYLLAQGNRTGFFGEDWFGLVNLGCSPAYHNLLTLCASGRRAAHDLTACW